MANQDERCMGCMSPLPAGREACGVCGYPAGGINPETYLQVRTLLSGRYLVGRVLEAGGDSALYIGYDQVQEAPVQIREFFPKRCAGGVKMAELRCWRAAKPRLRICSKNSAAMPVSSRACATCRP